MQRSCVAYHFDPAFRGSKESQNNSFRTSFPFAMKKTVDLSHFLTICLILSLSPPCCCSIQTDKNAEAAFAGGIGDWSSGIIWAFCQTLLKGHGTVLTPSCETSAFHCTVLVFFFFLLPEGAWASGRSGKDMQTYGAKAGCASSGCARLRSCDVTGADGCRGQEVQTILRFSQVVSTFLW